MIEVFLQAAVFALGSRDVTANNIDKAPSFFLLRAYSTAGEMYSKEVIT